MIAHRNFESNCKRIAKEIQSECNNPTSDAICLGSTEVIVSKSLIHDFNHEGKDKYIKEINKHLKGCKVCFKTLGYGHGWFIIFDIEFDDVDAEVEDW